MKKRLIALLLALVMALGLTVTAWAEETVTYMDWDDTQNALVERTLSQAYTLVTPSTIPTATPWGVNEATTWYVISGNVTIDGDLSMNGEVHLILMDGCSLTVKGTLGAGTLTVYGQSGGSGKLTVTSKTPNVEYDEQVVRGISASDLTINGGIVTASTVDADEITPATTNNASTTSFAINAHNLTINGGTVTSTSGNGYTSSYGIFSASSMIINGGTVTGTGGNGTSTSYGVCLSDGNLTLGGSARLTATGGTADESCGAYIGISHGGKLQMTSGTLIAKTTATVSDTVKAVKVRISFTPPTAPYWWRTAENGAFAKGPDTAYVYSSNKEATYTEITTVDPAPLAAPDASAHSHTRRQPTTTTTEVAPDTTTTTTDTVTSAKTFDAGIAVYGVMAVTSLLGMGYVGKKRV